MMTPNRDEMKQDRRAAAERLSDESGAVRRKSAKRSKDLDPAVDLMAALQASFEQARAARTANGKPQPSRPSDLIRSDPLCEFTVTRSEDDVYDTLRASVDDEDLDEVAEPVLDRAQMSARDINDLPDDAFAYIEPGGSKDPSGRTVPRALRHFPIHDADHVRNALARMSQSPFGDKAKAKIYKAAKKMGIGDYDTDSDMDMHKDMGMDRSLQPFGHEILRYERFWDLDDIEIMRGGDGRTVEAYAAVFDVPTEIKDQHGHYYEVINRSAFNRTISHGIGKVGFFYHHGMTLHGTPSDLGSVPIGSPIEIKADQKGLRTISRFNKSALADSVLEAIRAGDLRGYSFRGRIVQSTPNRIPRGRAGELPTIVRNELGLTEYGPTPTPYYADAGILAVRSAQLLAGLDDEARQAVFRMFSASTPIGDPEPRTFATPTTGPGAEDPHVEPSETTHSGRQLSDIARKIQRARILLEPKHEHEEA